MFAEQWTWQFDDNDVYHSVVDLQDSLDIVSERMIILQDSLDAIFDSLAIVQDSLNAVFDSLEVAQDSLDAIYDSLNVVNENVSNLGDAAGSSITGMAVTATLYVSPDGDDSDGSSWSNAYTTIQGALAVASTDVNECTLILIAPHATYYDINVTGDPTYAGNYILQGTERSWTSIKNLHAGATSIIKFTGKVSLRGLAFHLAAADNGVIFTGKGAHIYDCGFNATSSTGASTALWLDGATTIRGAYLENIDIFGDVTNTTGLLVDNAADCDFRHITIHSCLVGLQQVNASSDGNQYCELDIGDCETGIDIVGGDGAHFNDVVFHNNNTANITDAEYNHVYTNLKGDFAIGVEPIDFTGVNLPTGNSDNLYGAAVEVRAAGTSTRVFRITGLSMEADASEKFMIRLEFTGSGRYFDTFIFEAVASGINKKSFTFPTGSDYLFNINTSISASIKSESVGIDNSLIWLIVQEI